MDEQLKEIKRLRNVAKAGKGLYVAVQAARDYLDKQWKQHTEPTVADWDKLDTLLTYALKGWEEAE